MTPNELIKKLQSLPETVRENKEIVILGENGLEIEPEIKLNLKDKFDSLNLSSENIKNIILNYE